MKPGDVGRRWRSPPACTCSGWCRRPRRRRPDRHQRHGADADPQQDEVADPRPRVRAFIRDLKDRQRSSRWGARRYSPRWAELKRVPPIRLRCAWPMMLGFLHYTIENRLISLRGMKASRRRGGRTTLICTNPPSAVRAITLPVKSHLGYCGGPCGWCTIFSIFGVGHACSAPSPRGNRGSRWQVEAEVWSRWPGQPTQTMQPAGERIGRRMSASPRRNFECGRTLPESS